jgi:hypothetical protein
MFSLVSCITINLWPSPMHCYTFPAQSMAHGLTFWHLWEPVVMRKFGPYSRYKCTRNLLEMHTLRFPVLSLKSVLSTAPHTIADGLHPTPRIPGLEPMTGIICPCWANELLPEDRQQRNVNLSRRGHTKGAQENKMPSNDAVFTSDPKKNRCN